MNRKLLLADDSVTIQRVIELTFADEDVQVIAVGNGQDAIEHVQRDQPDIVLADIGMPERNGYEVAAFVKGNPATAHIPVVLLTGAFEPIDEGRARTVGCDGVLVKPFEPQLVISRVKDLLAGKQPAGMWTSAPPAQGPVRQAPSEVDFRTPPAQGGGDPLEAYFDQLDAAFSNNSHDTAHPATPAAPLRRDSIPLARRPAPADDPLAGWDPELQGDPARPAQREPLIPQRTTGSTAAAIAAPAPLAAAPAEATPAAAPAPQLPASLVDAFAALLAAEQKMGLSPSAAAGPNGTPAPAQPAAITDEMIDTITQRVLARLSDQTRPTILDVAERLVREEIERIKNIG